ADHGRSAVRFAYPCCHPDTLKRKIIARVVCGGSRIKLRLSWTGRLLFAVVRQPAGKGVPASEIREFYTPIKRTPKRVVRGPGAYNLPSTFITPARTHEHSNEVRYANSSNAPGAKVTLLRLPDAIGPMSWDFCNCSHNLLVAEACGRREAVNAAADHDDCAGTAKTE